MCEIMDFITEQAFTELLASSKLPIVIDFYADWCQPCKQYAPHFEAVAKEYAHKAVFHKINVDKSDVASTYEIMSIPSTVIFENGTIKSSASGSMGKAELKAWLEENLP